MDGPRLPDELAQYLVLCLAGAERAPEPEPAPVLTHTTESYALRTPLRETTTTGAPDQEAVLAEA